ncbi:hypothetical protein KJ365_00785 [Glaciecola sp. XM2]|jgi:hypothetical protein|uniref:hypothetical protein n=1 Tax=Glaciecola sp. XM2 TaxID=1914931 RepID=UPI001BDEFA64|nr:hypothetical protein [Glaciecola sp. XM2]MBT1449402.1 hypothetical protein [Glaciecola sp. XM2]
MQDTSTQAMTELALGLSMAFFSLLILALLSIGLPGHASYATQKSEELSTLTSEQSDMQLNDTLRLSQQVPDSENTTSSSATKSTIIFYYLGAYFDQNLASVDVYSMADTQDLIIAVSKDLSFSQVMQVHQDFASKEVQITAMNEQWENALSSANTSVQ